MTKNIIVPSKSVLNISPKFGLVRRIEDIGAREE